MKLHHGNSDLADPAEPSAERLYAVVVPDPDVLRARRIVNAGEIVRFENCVIEQLRDARRAARFRGIILRQILRQHMAQISNPAQALA